VWIVLQPAFRRKERDASRATHEKVERGSSDRALYSRAYGSPRKIVMAR
jgi:hypothetical protein